MTLREWMDRNHVTQLDLAEKTGISQSLLSKYLSGNRIPKIANALVIDKATEHQVPVESWLRRRKRAA
jgi:transcriptional regulator with XRE-family HTH domain